MNDRQLKVTPRPGSYARSADTVKQILDATLQVLVRDGYPALSLRRVAAQCGMGLGNLSYHFPSKEALLHGLLDAVLAGYTERAANLATHTDDARLNVKASIVAVLQDVQTYQTTHLFPELWSMANHDPVVAARLQDFYRSARVRAIELIRTINPELSEVDAETLCIFLSSMFEGSVIFAGHQKPYADRMPELAAIAVHSFLDLIDNMTPDRMHALRSEWSDAPQDGSWVI